MAGTQLETDDSNRLTRLFTSNGFSWLFAAFMAAVVVQFFLDDHGKVAVLNGELAAIRRQRDREIVQTNGDITNLQRDLLNAQQEIRNTQKALIQAQRRLTMAGRASLASDQDPAAMAFDSTVEEQPMSAAEQVKYQQLVTSLKAIDTGIENNLTGLVEGVNTLKAVRAAILDLRQKPWYRSTEGRSAHELLGDSEAALIAAEPMYSRKLAEIKSPNKNRPMNVEAAMFESEVKNNELTEAQHQLLRMQNDLLSAEKELGEIELLAPKNPR